MKLHQDHANMAYRIHAYQADNITVNKQIIRHSVIVMPDYLSDWAVINFANLSVDHFQRLAALQPELVVLGTGQQQRFPAQPLVVPLYQQHIGLEVMTLAAACRTYNILLGEGRRVAAALLFS